MLQRVTINGINFPRLYIAENQEDADVAVSEGIPFIKWTQGQEALIRMLLRPALENMFPYISWDRVLGRRETFKTEVQMWDIDGETRHFDDSDGNGKLMIREADGTHVEFSDTTTGARLFDGKGDHATMHSLDIEDYMGDLSSSVNLDVLQRLRLMPTFIGDILDCVKTNIGNGIYWREGYNKRRNLATGRYDGARNLPNLIILDVSGSIPRGISATMISLIDTLRSQLSADLIVTSSMSVFYPMGSKLPTPQKMRDQFGYGNESYQFFDILTKNVRGRHFGHVISFGDNDAPYYYSFLKAPERYSLDGTIVEHVHHYHANRYTNDRQTGYAKWCHMLARQPQEEYDFDWCNVIVNY